MQPVFFNMKLIYFNCYALFLVADCWCFAIFWDPVLITLITEILKGDYYREINSLELAWEEIIQWKVVIAFFQHKLKLHK